MGKYDTAVRCAQIRTLVEENQYLKAMEEIETVDFDKIPNISDLYLFADVFLKAEKMDIAKELYYTVYRRTASRPALYRLLMLVIQMGDIEEARELYLAYEVTAGVTLDTYELRYRLAKAAGEPRAKLVDILEHLKEDEYTEEWGFQLAQLYEMEGMRERCIEECERIHRWFGEGKIVDKAEQLKKRCMAPDWSKPVDDMIPEPEKPDVEEAEEFAYAPVHVEEILASKEEKENEGSLEETEYKVEPEAEPHQEVRQENVQQELRQETTQVEQQKEEIAATADEQSASEPDDQSAPEPDEHTEEQTDKPSQPGFLKRFVNYFKADIDMFEGDDDALDDEGEEAGVVTAAQSTPEPESETASLDERQPASLEDEQILGAGFPMESQGFPLESQGFPMESQGFPMESLEEKLQEINEHQGMIRSLEINIDSMLPPTHQEMVLPKEPEPEPVPVQKAPEPEPVRMVPETPMDADSDDAQVKSHPLGMSALTEDIVENVSKNGIRYNTLKGAIYKIHREEGLINFALTGGSGGIPLAVAKKLSKELKKVKYFEAKNIGKIVADRMDSVNLDEWAEKFIGGCMYITDAPSLSNKSVQSLTELITKYQKQIVIILEGSYDEMDSFLNYHKEFERLITYKVQL